MEIDDTEVLVFPEPKEIIHKCGDEIIDKDYKIVYGYNADPLEVETAFRIVKRIEEPTK